MSSEERRDASNILVASSAAAMFVAALLIVFYGFVAYYSRIELSNELVRREIKVEKNIDTLFALIDRAERDSIEVERVRAVRAQVLIVAAEKISRTRSLAYRSDEYNDYTKKFSALVLLLESIREELDTAYLASIRSIAPENADITQAQRFFYPVYRTNSTKTQAERTEYYKLYAPIVDQMYNALLRYDANLGIVVRSVIDFQKFAIEGSDRKLREILTRSPQLALASEIDLYKLQIDESRQNDIFRFAGLVRAYTNPFMRPALTIMQWPTIALTLVVTLATGWLGGLISFLGASAAQQGAEGSASTANQRPSHVDLLRRSFLGVTAALGIFLFAGSGLLVFSAQSNGSAVPNSIELSPYFVAFLAFVSGFLADDAFIRLTKAGRAMLQAEGDNADQNSGADEVKK